MVCPNNECGAELPDDYDLNFCDQCNADLFCCGNSECPAFGVLTTNARRCTQCGEPVEPNGPRGDSPQPAAQEQTAPQEQATPTAPQQATTSTELFQAGAGRIFFRHSDGWTIELADGDILGRTEGKHVDRLGSIKVISGTHAKITREQDGWYITDQKSLNKTWVNGKEAEPYKQVKIKQNDVVTMANQKFTVTEL